MTKRRKIAIASLVAMALLVCAGWWWFSDPFRGVVGIEIDQTIYYHEAKPLFLNPRRQRTIFMRGTDMKKLLAQTKVKYMEADGWSYFTEAMPRAFRASRPAPGDEMPETISAINTMDGRMELIEIRTMSSAEVQLVRRTQGSDAFLLFPGAPVYRRPTGDLDRTRFLTGG